MLKRTVKAFGILMLGMALGSHVSADDHHWDGLTFDQLDAVAETALHRAQALSLDNNLEYCGYIAFNGNDKLQYTAPIPGDIESCTPPEVPGNWELIASYHTHGALDPNDPEQNFELPSGGDLEGDSEEGVDGYLATPGGRFWFIDTVEEVVFMINDIGFVERDPSFTPDTECLPYESYSFEEIFLMEDEGLAACEL